MQEETGDIVKWIAICFIVICIIGVAGGSSDEPTDANPKKVQLISDSGSVQETQQASSDDEEKEESQNETEKEPSNEFAVGDVVQTDRAL